MSTPFSSENASLEESEKSPEESKEVFNVLPNSIMYMCMEIINL